MYLLSSWDEIDVRVELLADYVWAAEDDMFKKIPTMKSKPLSHDKKYQLILTYIGCACYLTHLAAWGYFFVNQ